LRRRRCLRGGGAAPGAQRRCGVLKIGRGNDRGRRASGVRASGRPSVTPNGSSVRAIIFDLDNCLRLQESKVRALGIAALFDAVVIDAIDEADHPGKERIFLDLIARYRLEPADVAVVGDNPASELAAARRLGLRAVQLLRPGVVAAENVRARVSGLAELRELLETMG
jgi:FMN phosphatase YigB (HAD superfamily)